MILERGKTINSTPHYINIIIEIYFSKYPEDNVV